MAPRPVHHPLRADRATDPGTARQRAIAAHPAGGTATTRPARPDARVVALRRSEEGSMTTEYGLLVVVGATLASLVVRWASGGAVFDLLDRIIEGAGALLGL